jgi:hypothetical protein
MAERPEITNSCGANLRFSDPKKTRSGNDQCEDRYRILIKKRLVIAIKW